MALGLLALDPLSDHLPSALALLALGSLALWSAARRLEVDSGSVGAAVLAGALLLRLPLLPLAPTLSDDVLRYLWDGRVAAAGRNPYALPPAAAELAPWRDELWRSLPHRQVPTVYPPLAVAAFSIAARTPWPLPLWKALAAAGDLAACALLLALARRLGVPAGRTVWYAWNPLVALETAGMGHVDALGVAACLGAVLLLTSRRSVTGSAAGLAAVGGAAACAAAGALTKLVPLVALPLWGRAYPPGTSRRRFWATALALLVLACGPVVAATGGVPPGLLVYGRTWEFNGPLFEPLWRLLDAVDAAPRTKTLLEWIERRSERWYLFERIYPYVYPQLLAKAVLGVALLAAIAASLRERDVVAGTGRLFGRALLLSATVYPWYLLWVLPWAALARHPAWLALGALLPLSYLAQDAGVPLFPWLWLAIWGPFFALLALGRGRWGAR